MDKQLLAELEETLKEVIKIPAPPGFEEPLAQQVSKEIKSLGLKPERDNLGNAYTRIDGGGPVLLITAHMDETALLIHHVDEMGRLRFKTLGGLKPMMLYSQHVIVHTSKEEVPGIIPAIPPHLGKGDEKQISIEELYIDVGLESKDEAQDLGINPPLPATLKPTLSGLRKGEILVGRPLDNRVSVAALLTLARRLVNIEAKTSTLILAWTVQEEVGIRGARALASRIQPDYMLALDVMTYSSPPATGGYKPGGGPVLRIYDRSMISCKKLDRLILDTASQNGITVQRGVGVGGTDAAAGWMEGACSSGIMTPSQYTHSTVEKIYKRDWFLQTKLTLLTATRFLRENTV
ncbi:MAG: M28 family peptidase [Desulfurococcales archaeon]|nr:M28 family peptidase [Desulfurococcales archaeon]